MDAIFHKWIDQCALHRLHKKKSKNPHFAHADSYPDSHQLPEDYYHPPDIPDFHFQKDSIGLQSGYQSGVYSFSSQIESGDTINDEVSGEYFEPSKNVADTHVVFVHGWRMNSIQRISKIYLRQMMAKKWNLYFFSLPYHRNREPVHSLYGGELMVSANLDRTLQAIQQAVSDLRALIRWIKQEKQGKVILIGISLGGFLTNLTATVEKEIDTLVSVFYANRLSYSVWNTIPGRYIQAEIESHGITEQQLADYWAITDPSRFKPLVPKERILLFTALYDQYVAIEDADRLWESWDRPARHVYPCGHAGLALCKSRIGRDTLAFLDKL